MKSVDVYEKGERVLIEMEIGNVRFVGGRPVYELKDPRNDNYYDSTFTNEQLVPIQEEAEEES